MNFKPTYDRLIVEPINEEEKTLAGLVLPNGANLKMCKGKVIATGKGHLMPDYKFRACEHTVDDIVIYYKHDAMPIFIEGIEYHCLKDNQPFGKL
jgi:chaperonin GroES